MPFVKILESKSKRTKCSCCGDVIPTCQKFSKIEGDNYCHNSDCHTKYMPMNHEIETAVFEDLEGKSEREREIHATYRANGVSTETYFRDKQWEGR